MTYTPPFDSGQPNGGNGGRDQNCMNFVSGGKWHDRECTDSKNILCSSNTTGSKYQTIG